MVRQSELQFAKMIAGAVAAVFAAIIYNRWLLEKPLPAIPVQSWDKYVEQQKKAGRDI
ncbi:hypothetical protein KIN20_025430 [Parelaphostrongylus tenuis]|uniref:Uncharacterized protein n=1 Tax=Parelaphostrongylus tenuis TaxID=148309 RepID=A0AAD5MZH6_PARTN|nr:hypothetical protein KIN20_025430 [Parelaphostrongylus tenuis]